MKITITPGESLWEALEKQNIRVERPCSGRGTCRQCKVEIERYGRVLACQFREPGTYEVKLPEGQHFSVLNRSPLWNDKAQEPFLSEGEPFPRIGVDIGTTTVALAGNWHGIRTTRSFVNPQRSYGADVISRIDASNHGKGELLRGMLRKKLIAALCEIVDELTEGKPRSVGKCRVAIGANTTMMHLLRGFSCEGLGRVPFQPVDLKLGREYWEAGGYCFDVTYLPGISTYIGADITSGIYGLSITESEKPQFLLDLGTNGEMAVGNNKRLLCASAAAGPAFEGSELAMRFHAAGIIAWLGRMKDAEIMDEYGLLADPYFEKGYPVPPEDGAEENLRITQEDIREIQLAKGAIRAGIEILLDKFEITAAEVERVYLAGGMGYYLNPEDAIAIGILPPEFTGKTIAAGNTCLSGIRRYFMEEPDAAGRKLTRIAESAQEIILAQEPEFEERYVESMNFDSYAPF